MTDRKYAFTATHDIHQRLQRPYPLATSQVIEKCISNLFPTATQAAIHIADPKRQTRPRPMSLLSLIKNHIGTKRKTAAARKETKLEKNDHQRLNENLLIIALKRPTSVNSLTDRDPTRVAMEKKKIEDRWWERD